MKTRHQISSSTTCFVLVDDPKQIGILPDDVGYPSFDTCNGGARYLTEPDYTAIFGSEAPPSHCFIPIGWPESQRHMKPTALENATIQALCEHIVDSKGLVDFGDGACWVPLCMIEPTSI